MIFSDDIGNVCCVLGNRMAFVVNRYRSW